MNRLSFGPRPGDIDHVRSVGIEGYIQEQLSPSQTPQPIHLTQQLKQLKTLNLGPSQLFQEYQYKPRLVTQKGEAEKRTARQKRNLPLQEARQARLSRALASPRQLEEVMVNFWFNHFNVSVTKGWVKLWVGSYENTMRPHVLGSFPEFIGCNSPSSCHALLLR